MAVVSLRDYQQDALNELHAWFQSTEKRRPLIVAPTGSGKSHLIAAICKSALQHPKERGVILCHRKEIIEQNVNKLLKAWPAAPIGIYSASLGRKKIARCTFANIQSIYKKAYEVMTHGTPTFVIVDEAHLIPHGSTGMYHKFLKELIKFNSKLVIIGLTATPYRMQGGLLHKGQDPLFDDIAVNISIKRLIEEGFLCPLVSKSAVAQADLSDVKIRGNEFVIKDMEAAIDQTELTNAAITEAEQYGKDRKSWLVFCSGVDHVEHVVEIFKERGYSAAGVTGNTLPMMRDKLLADFKTGKIQVLANCDVLTTGFDAPNVDLLMLLRGTQSVGLYVQILGRGMRIHPNKKNCLVLDYAGNLERHGPIDQIEVVTRNSRGSAEGEAEVKTAPTKICPECREPVHAASRECACGFLFPEPQVRHEERASNSPVMGAKYSVPECVEVKEVEFKKHQKKGSEKPPTLRIKYKYGLAQDCSEYLCFSHPRGSFPYQKACNVWKQLGGVEPYPMSVDEALERTGELQHVTHIYRSDQRVDGKTFDRVISRIVVSQEDAEQQRNQDFEDFMDDVINGTW